MTMGKNTKECATCATWWRVQTGMHYCNNYIFICIVAVCAIITQWANHNYKEKRYFLACIIIELKKRSKVNVMIMIINDIITSPFKNPWKILLLHWEQQGYIIVKHNIELFREIIYRHRHDLIMYIYILGASLKKSSLYQ